MRGSDRVGNEFTTVVQRVYRSDGSFFDDSSRDPHMIFEPEDGHDHWHLKNAARYSLWNQAQTAEVAPAMKAGFCLIDSQRRETHGPSSPVYDDRREQLLRAERAHPRRASSRACPPDGVTCTTARSRSSGWTFQTCSPAPALLPARGHRPRRHHAREQRGEPARLARCTVTIPGYAANPVAAGTISASGPTTIPLSTTSYGTGLGTRTFRIIVPPRHGTLNVPTRPDVHEHLGRLHAAAGLGRSRQLHLHGPQLLEQLPALPGRRGRDAERRRSVARTSRSRARPRRCSPARARGCSRP